MDFVGYDEIRILHDELIKVQNFNPIAVDNFVQILKKFRKNSPENVMNDGAVCNLLFYFHENTLFEFT